MASSFLYRTQTAGTSTKKFTFSCWAKLSGTSGTLGLFSTSNGWADGTGIAFAIHDSALRIYNGANGVGGSNMNAVANRLFRDNSGWYHFHFMGDTDESTIANRLKVYVNNELQTLVNVGGSGLNLPAQSASWTNLGVNGQTMQVGRASYNGSHYFDGYISHAAFVDGTAVAPTSFGATDSTSGIWKFKSPTGLTWGNNGFHLKFENSGTLGLDSSGETNNLTVSGDLKQALDTPSNVHATLNPLNYTSSAVTYSNGNNKATYPGSWIASLGTIGVQAGKYYWEAKVVSGNNQNLFYGISTDAVDLDTAPQNKGGVISQHINGDRYVDTTYTASAAEALTNGDILGVALDLDSGTKTVKFYKNGSLLTSSSSINLTSTFDNEFVFPIFIGNNSSASSIWEVNFGNGFFGTTAITSAGSNGNGSLFEYDVPSGFYALNTKNINTYG